MVDKLLIANRGEIAVRIMRTAAEMGIRTVAVYSDADVTAPHVLAADQAMCLGDPEPGASYLNIDKLLQAAKDTGADAIHPGYGFLSENPLFAERVKEAGLVFVGPPADAMHQVGSKTSARQLAVRANVPIIPGLTAAESRVEELQRAADQLGYPVLIKASAGGGGKGMRLVNEAKELPEAAQRAASEASSSFGDASIYLEKALIRPRHVEVQILADTHGNCVHLFERECSVQRRHQKIIEESPSPAVTPELRAAMGEAAVRIARAAGYVNAGTVEFLLDQSGAFYFLEVNTRLQVEHPVTEFVTGLDLVRHQIEIARGKPLPFAQADLHQRGHAIECRIYAEDPTQNFMPSPGVIHYAHAPQGPGIRYDSGIYSGLTVPFHYDPILSKLIAWAEDRPSAIRRLVRALEECVVLGVATPIELLIDILSHDAFERGELHTSFLEEHFADWKPADDADLIAQLGKKAADLVIRQAAPSSDPSQGDAWSPWNRLGKWDLAEGGAR